MRASGNFGDVYQYDTMPKTLRVQMQYIFRDALGQTYDTDAREPDQYWATIRKVVCEENGLNTLIEKKDPSQDILDCLEAHPDVMLLLDVVEVGLRVIDLACGTFELYERENRGIKRLAKVAVEDANTRMRQAAFGYEYASGKLIRIDSQIAHSEIVKPALQLLSDPRFDGAEKEYLSAYKHYRKSEFKPAIVHANSAFESVLKTICHLRNWPVTEGAVASGLLKVVRANGLTPDYLEKSFDQFATTLENGLPKVRNNAGGHGDGPKPKEVPRHIAAYALHLAATNIVMLVDAFNALPPLPPSS